MRKLTFTVFSDPSKTGSFAAETVPLEDAQEFISNGGIAMLTERLDVLERDGPWKPEVQNSLTPPSKPLWDACPKLSDQ